MSLLQTFSDFFRLTCLLKNSKLNSRSSRAINQELEQLNLIVTSSVALSNPRLLAHD